MGTKCHMSPNLSCLIELHSSHCPFALSCAIIDLYSTSSPTQTITTQLVTPPILTNHTPPTNFLYKPPTFCVNMRSQFYTFPNPLDHAHLWHLSPLIILVHTIGHDHTPQPTPIFSTHFQPPPKVLCPTFGRQFTSQRLTRHYYFCQTSNSSNLNPYDHLGSIPSIVLPCLHKLGHGFHHWMSSSPFI
jgi:hypothetical protein